LLKKQLKLDSMMMS